MKLTETQIQFIKNWGSLGSKWGINRTLAQIHALFLITDISLSTEDIMKTLKISRGNVNMNVRTLLDWNLVYKENKLGERREYFVGEKDMWLTLKRVLKVRKERELDPMLEILENLLQKETHEEGNEIIAQRLKNIKKFASQADGMLDKFIKMDENWFWTTFSKLIK